MKCPTPPKARAAFGEFTSAWNRLIRRFSRSWCSAGRSDISRYGTRAMQPSAYRLLIPAAQNASLAAWESIDDDAQKQGSRRPAEPPGNIMAGRCDDRHDHHHAGCRRDDVGCRYGAWSGGAHQPIAFAIAPEDIGRDFVHCAAASVG